MDGTYVPLTFALLKDKSEETYKSMLQLIAIQCTKSGFYFSPTTVLLDFEKASHNAFHSIFPYVSIYCCGFHFGQAVFRAIRDKFGLYEAYKDQNNPMGTWLKTLFGLPYLSPSQVEDVFAFNLHEEGYELGIPEKFLDYLTRTYIDSSTALYPPSMWACFPDPEFSHPRTTNAAESFHRHMKSLFNRQHPNIFTFTTTLMAFQEESYVALQSWSSPKIYNTQRRKEKIAYLIDILNQYSFSDMDDYTFTRLIAFKNLPAEL